MSYKITVHPKRKAASRLVSKVGSRLQEALILKKAGGKFTQADLARRLEKDRSVVNRLFSGYANLTVDTLGELAWALDQEVDVIFRPKGREQGANEHVKLSATIHAPKIPFGFYTNHASSNPAKAAAAAVAAPASALNLRAQNG